MLKKMSLKPSGKIHSEREEEFYSAFNFVELIQDWKSIVGDFLGANTTPIKIHQGSLVVLARHAIFSQELKSYQEEIKLKVIKKFPLLRPMVQRLSFMTDEMHFMNRQKVMQESRIVKQLHPFSPEYKKARFEADKLLAEIEDPEEKELWLSIYLQMSAQK